MALNPHRLCNLLLAGSLAFAQATWAKEIKVTIPKRSKLTPVQRLNRDGVEQVRKQHYERAQALFYKAYLYDSGDPFTLYNLGYVSELQGDLDRAQKFYELAAEQSTDAVIDKSSMASLKGKPMADVTKNLQDVAMRVNRDNVEAIRLIKGGDPVAAQILLLGTLKLDPKNAFTLNNLGVAKEAQGELGDALYYYTQASNQHSTSPVVVSVNNVWRGRPVSQMARESANKVQDRMARMQDAASQADLYNLRGVYAMNRNDSSAAGEDFRKAFTLDPNSAFSLNNRGYLAEMEGDLETAQYYYDKARLAPDAGKSVGLATRQSAEGAQVAAVADDGGQKVDQKLAAEAQVRRQEHRPIELKKRGAAPTTNPPSTPPQQ